MVGQKRKIVQDPVATAHVAKRVRLTEDCFLNRANTTQYLLRQVRPSTGVQLAEPTEYPQHRTNGVGVPIEESRPNAPPRSPAQYSPSSVDVSDRYRVKDHDSLSSSNSSLTETKRAEVSTESSESSSRMEAYASYVDLIKSQSREITAIRDNFNRETDDLADLFSGVTTTDDSDQGTAAELEGLRAEILQARVDIGVAKQQHKFFGKLLVSTRASVKKVAKKARAIKKATCFQRRHSSSSSSSSSSSDSSSDSSTSWSSSSSSSSSNSSGFEPPYRPITHEFQSINWNEPSTRSRAGDISPRGSVLQYDL
ncbi:hypothetical protein M426DRAFT_9593 [Hypoxylon sp. CI-4A]|nr:hypothetical protein M426DRAFT_9593 [Hypoxylon sp. CI-4A]